MNEPDSILATLLDPEEDIGGLLWLFYEPLSKAALENSANTDRSVLEAMDGRWRGAVKLFTNPSSGGLEANLWLTVYHTTEPARSAEAAASFKVFQIKNGCLVSACPLQYISRDGTAEAHMHFWIPELAALAGTGLILADQDRYCFEHYHCASCGVQAVSEDEFDRWDTDNDMGPGGHIIAFCTICIDDCRNRTNMYGFKYYQTFNTVHPVKHSSHPCKEQS